MAIEHVVVLCMENRAFDHMLGFLDHPNPAYRGLRRDGPHANAGWDGDPSVAVNDQAKPVLPVGPDHSHDAVMQQLAMTGAGPNRRPTNQGFVTSYERRARGLSAPSHGGLLGRVANWSASRKSSSTTPAPGRGPLVMACQSPDQVPVLSRLALDFAVCDHWFCSVPGETWPNRNFLHAATSNGETNIELRAYTDRTIFELLEDNDATWRIYHDDTPQVWAFPALWDTPDRHANWYPTSRFAGHVAAGDLPTYSFIEPNHRPPLHTADHDVTLGGTPDIGTSQHPENNLVANEAYDTYHAVASTDFSRGEALIATIYQALRANPALFERTLLLITYDEHGGLYDHMPPPTGIPAPVGGRRFFARLLHAIYHQRASSFDFTMLGPRVPAVIVSPLIPAGTLVSTVHDHASVPATLRALYAPHAAPLTSRDAWSPPFHDVATLTTARTDLPDLSDFTAAAAMPTPPAMDLPAPNASSAAIPDYYTSFLEQAELVRQRLAQVGEPEIASVDARPDVRNGARITDAFSLAAHRHRQP